MRTEEDLRQLFRDTGDAITTADLSYPAISVAEERQGRPRTSAGRRRLVAALAVGTAAAVIATVVVAARTPTSPGVAGTPNRPIWASALNAPSGWQLENRHLVRGGGESITLYSVDHGTCDATTGLGEAPGALEPTRTVTVGDHEAQVGRMQTWQSTDLPLGAGAGWHVRWTSAAQRWVDVRCEQDDSTVAGGLALAGRLQLGGAGATLPVILSDLPDGLAANEIIVQHDIYPHGDAPRVMMPLITGLGATTQPSLEPDQAKQSGTKTVLAIVEKRTDFSEVYPLKSSGRMSAERIADINGYPAWLRTTKEGTGTTRDLVVVDHDQVLWLSTGDYTSAELIDIAGSMGLAPRLQQESTWYPVPTALGNR